MMNSSKNSKRPPISSTADESPAKLQKTNTGDKKKQDEDLNAQIRAAVIAAAFQGSLYPKKDKPAPKKSESKTAATETKSPKASPKPTSTKPATSKPSTPSSSTKSASTTPTAKVTPGYKPSAASKTTPTTSTKPPSDAKTTESRPNSDKTVPVSKSSDAKKTESKPTAPASKPRGKTSAPETKTVYAPSQDYPEINFYHETNKLMPEVKRQSRCNIFLREEGPKVFMVITSNPRDSKPPEEQFKEAEQVIDGVWGNEACEKMMAGINEDRAKRNRYGSKKEDHTAMPDRKRPKRDSDPPMSAFQLDAFTNVDDLNRKASQDYKPPASFEDSYTKKRLKEIQSKEPRWSDMKLWEKVEMVLDILKCMKPQVSFGDKNRRGNTPLFACKISLNDLSWYGAGDSMEKSKINAYQGLWRTLEPLTLSQTRDDSYRKPFKEDSSRETFKEDSYRKPFKDSFQDDSFRKPFKDDSFRKPFKSDSFRKPFKDDSFRKPFRDDSFRKPFHDDSFRKPFKDDSFRKPFQDDSFRKPFKDDSFRNDDSFRKPFKDDSFKKDDSYRKPFRTDSFRKPFRDESFRKPFRDDSFRKSSPDVKGFMFDETPKNPQEEELERLLDCVEQVRSDLEEAKESYKKAQGNRYEEQNISEKIEKLKSEEEHLKMRLEKALNESEGFSTDNRFEERTRKVLQTEEVASQNYNVWQRKGKNEGWAGKRQQTDWNKGDQGNMGESFGSKNIPVWNSDSSQQQGQQQTFQRSNRGRDFQMRGERAGGRGRGRSDWRGDNQARFGGQKKDWGYDGQRNEKGYNWQKNESGFGGQKDEWEFNDQRNEKRFDSQKNENRFGGQKKKWGFDSEKTEKESNWQRNERGFSGQKNQWEYNTPMSEAGFDNPKNEDSFQKEWEYDGQRNQKGYTTEARKPAGGYYSQKSAGYFSQKNDPQKGDGRSENQKNEGRFERDYESNVSDNRGWSNKGYDTQNRRNYFGGNESQVKDQPQPWQDKPQPFVSVQQEPSNRFRTSVVKRDESQPWGHRREPSIEVISTPQEPQNYTPPAKAKSLDPRLETFSTNVNPIYQTELMNLKTQVNEQLEDIKDCQREGNALVQEQLQEARRTTNGDERRSLFLKINKLEESVNDLRAKEEQIIKTFKEKVVQLELKYQPERNMFQPVQKSSGYSTGYSTATQEPKGYFSTEGGGNRYSTDDKIESFQRNVQQAGSINTQFGNRGFQGGPSEGYTAAYESNLQSSSNWNQQHGVRSTGLNKPFQADGSSFQQNKHSFEASDYRSTTMADTFPMQGTDYDSRNKFPSQNLAANTQRSVSSAQYQMKDANRQAVWASDGNTSNPSTGNPYSSKGFTTSSNRGYFSTQPAGNVQKW